MRCGPPRQSQKVPPCVNRSRRQRLNRYRAIRSSDKRGEPETKSRTVAVLKSGVVDGMAYTLYVDGSIEAELPQGTVRFASIHELRNHLAKNS